ncbi:hypothetical protein GMOD_00003879 [Pyrenophora seminiperda CCB06]|uniref:Uncharacterized protein n=1 Tax=Pyrenophora seminiperda CCB06 TaxID=1302712 RepID=A0A3M7M062_9PLEO|nr:hypothetical protein GMOD_00003879 [Pyrenophora seminiperda CCB06]
MRSCTVQPVGTEGAGSDLGLGFRFDATTVLYDHQYAPCFAALRSLINSAFDADAGNVGASIKSTR